MREHRRAGLALTVASLCLAASACTSGEPAPGEPTRGQPQLTARSRPHPVGSVTPTRAPALTLVATGDVLLHEPLWEQARLDATRTGKEPMDFGPMLGGIQPYVSRADIALCHLETPLAAPGGPYAGYPSFAVPPQILPALVSAGYDVCSTASNHTFDRGARGVERTLDQLDAAGIAHAGSARSPAESSRTTIVPANGVRVAVLSYTYGFNGTPVAGGWRANVIDIDHIRAAARTARRRGAEVVVLAMHWGTEYQQVPNAQQVSVAREIARSPDVDLIISHHAHVVEPIEKIGRTWVAYGLGNLVAWHRTPGPANAEGLLVRFTFTRRSTGRFVVTKAEYEPLLVTRDPPLRVLDVPIALMAKTYGSSTRSRLLAALARTTRVVTSRGAGDAGLVRAQLDGRRRRGGG